MSLSPRRGVTSRRMPHAVRMGRSAQFCTLLAAHLNRCDECRAGKYCRAGWILRRFVVELSAIRMCRATKQEKV